MNPEKEALLRIIREMKPEGISDLEAALNLVTNHAKEIERLRGLVRGALLAWRGASTGIDRKMREIDAGLLPGAERELAGGEEDGGE